MSPEATARCLVASTTDTDLAELIDSLEQQLAELSRAQAAESQGALAQWVVLTAASQPLALDVDDGYASNPRPCAIEQATRMCSKDARLLAWSMRDENGNRGRAYPLGLGYAVVRATLERTLNVLKGAQGPH